MDDPKTPPVKGAGDYVTETDLTRSGRSERHSHPDVPDVCQALKVSLPLARELEPAETVASTGP